MYVARSLTARDNTLSVPYMLRFATGASKNKDDNILRAFQPCASPVRVGVRLLSLRHPGVPREGGYVRLRSSCSSLLQWFVQLLTCPPDRHVFPHPRPRSCTDIHTHVLTARAGSSHASLHSLLVPHRQPVRAPCQTIEG